MTVVPQYDEFGIYTTKNDIICFVDSLFEQSFLSEEDVIFKCDEALYDED